MTRVARQGYTLDPKLKAKPYRVGMSINGKPTYIGHFATPEEALAAYKAARAKYPMMPPVPGRGASGRKYDREPCPHKGCRRRIVSHFMERHTRSCKYGPNYKI